jgi:hypothetical protein
MTNRSGSHLRTRKIDPELPFKIGLVNEREARESGLWPKALGAWFARSMLG